MEETDKQPFQFEDHVAFKQKGRSGSRCAKCCVCFVMFLAVLLAFLCVAAVVVFGILYWQLVINQAVMALEDRIVALEMQLNESQAMQAMVAGQVSPQVQVQLNQTMDAVENLETRLNQSTENLATQITTVTGEITSQVGQARADLMQEVSDAQRTTYTRWGHNSCPSVDGTTLLYNGKIGAASRQVQGSGANHLCMPPDPEYSQFVPGVQAHSLIYGTEYIFEDGNPNNNNDVPCAVCSVTTRVQVVMIPAKMSCPADWTMEYIGFIMSDTLQGHRTSFICVDNAFESTGSSGIEEASELRVVEASCQSFDCSTGAYDGDRELTCVVCTK